MTGVTIRILAAMSLLALCASSASADSRKPEKPQTKVTQTLRAETYKSMEAAQKAFEAKDYKGAEHSLDPLKAKFDKLNDYEKATLWNLYAAIFRAQEDNKRAIEAYFNVLKQNNLPEGLRNDALFSLAQTYFVVDDYNNAIKALNKWFAVSTDPQPDAYVLLAQAYYQLQKYDQAKGPILKAMSIAKQRNQPYKENWLALLRAVFYELKDYPNATKVMEVLVSLYPKNSYFMQLAGLYGLANDQRKQADLMNAAYTGGFVSNPGDLLNVARLYMAEGAPQRAVELMLAKLRDKTLQINPEILQLLAQAMALAKDTDQSIPVLTKLAEMTGESKHYNYLGQAYIMSGDWGKAAGAFQLALNGKDVSSPDSIRMQLGMALYNDKKTVQARDVFKAIPSTSPNAESASNWVKFINTEIERNDALKSRSG